MIFLIRVLGGFVFAGACYSGGADLYKLLKKRVVGPGGDSTPPRDAGGSVTSDVSSAGGPREQP